MGNRAQKFGPKTQNLVQKALLGPKISRISENFSVFMEWYC